MGKTPGWLIKLDIVSRGNRIRERICLRNSFLKKIIRLIFYLWDIIIGLPRIFVLILIIGKAKTRSKQNQLVVVAIAKNESEYIREWVAYHKTVGIDRIYLFDNDSTDGMKKYIQDFIDTGFVIYKEIHGQCRQMDAYNDALQRYGSKCRYMAFIDCDEFLAPVNSNENMVEILDSYFACHKKAAALAVNWCMFGSSHFEDKPDGLLIENFVWRAKIGREGTNVIKSIICPSRTLFFDNPHYAVCRFGYAVYDINGKFVENWANTIEEYNGIKVNHYFTKSKEQWIKRRAIGKADLGSNDKRGMEEFYKHDNNDLMEKPDMALLNKVKTLVYDK